MADLPVPVGCGGPEGGFHPVVFEAGQRNRGPAAHRGPVLAGGPQHGRQARPVADGPEGGHGGFPTAGVRVGVCHLGEFSHGGAVVPFAQEPGRADHDEGVRVVQCAHQCRREEGAGTHATHGDGGVNGAPPYRDRPLGQGGGDIGRGQCTQPSQSAEGGLLHARVGVVEVSPDHGRGVAGTPVARHADPAPSHVGAAVSAPIRGRIVAHRLSMSDPDATADGDPAAIPTPDAPGSGALRPPLDSAPAGTAPTVRGKDRRRRRWPAVLAALVVVVFVAGLIAARTNVDYYVITPGEATPVSQYIEVPSELNHPLTGKILLTDVFVTQLTALSYALTYVQNNVFGSTDEIYSGADLLAGAPTQGQFLNQGFLQMAQAQNFATASALTYLGYTVKSTNAGALVYGIEPDSPAEKTLELGQVIEKVNGTPTPTDCALVSALHGLQPGAKATLAVEESRINDEGALVPGAVVEKSVTLGVPPKSLVETGCEPPRKPTAFLGIDPETQQAWDFPVDVKIDTPQIGGPSAGLAMTLGIIDKLSSGRLTGHRVIAATGTIDQYGNVGQVGGVPEKTIAVERAGATVFLVPKPEYAKAEAKATPQLRVYGVNTLDQALRILKRLGGKVPTSPVPA